MIIRITKWHIAASTGMGLPRTTSGECNTQSFFIAVIRSFGHYHAILVEGMEKEEVRREKICPF